MGCAENQGIEAVIMFDGLYVLQSEETKDRKVCSSNARSLPVTVGYLGQTLRLIIYKNLINRVNQF
jgi:hypothetical protein